MAKYFTSFIMVLGLVLSCKTAKMEPESYVYAKSLKGIVYDNVSGMPLENVIIHRDQSDGCKSDKKGMFIHSKDSIRYSQFGKIRRSPVLFSYALRFFHKGYKTKSIFVNHLELYQEGRDKVSIENDTIKLEIYLERESKSEKGQTNEKLHR